MEKDTESEKAASSSASARAPLGEAWHTRSIDEVARALQVDHARGLTDGRVAHQRARFGPNSLAEPVGRSALAIAASQFKSLIVVLLFAAALAAFGLGDRIEAVAILSVILFNAVVGFLTEWRAQQSLTALRRQAVPVT